MASLSLKTKFTLIAALAVVTVAYAALQNFLTLESMIAEAGKTQIAGTVMRQHLDGDMMHDAIRADVLKATLGLKTKNAEMVKEAKDDATDHGKRFSDSLTKNLALDLPSDVHKLFQNAEPALKAYNVMATKFIDVALDDVAHGTTRTDALLPEFEKAFESLEKAQGDISDKLEVYAGQIKDAQVAKASSATTSEIILALITVVITLFIPIFARNVLFAPLSGLISAMQELARGSLNINVPYAYRTDEVGDLAAGLLIFQKNAQDKVRLEQEQEEQKKQDALARRKVTLDMADNFERRVGELVKGVAAAATELQATAESMTTTTRTAADQAGAVAAVSEETARNANTVAAATEELSASFSEINQRMNNSMSIVQDAVSQTQDTSAKVRRLDEAARKIGEVVKLISDVAEQTNLLALNATIEAARAGDAGKGFAVVAAEVKALASQTAKATEEVGTQIRAIQSAVRESTQAMDIVSSSIAKVNEISGAIATAVEAQASATVSIASNVAEASRGSSEIQSNISGVLHAAEESGSAAAQVLAAAGELSRSGEMLSGQVDSFLQEVRAA